jgi:hypothetical protein
MVPREDRIYLTDRIAIHDAFSGEEFGCLLDLSSHGMGVITKAKHAVGDVFELKILRKVTHPILETQNVQHLDFTARVVWVKSIGTGKFKIGLAYHPFNAKSKLRLNQLIKDLQ